VRSALTSAPVPRQVFEELQAHVPFHFVGRAAGAPLLLRPSHFAAWDTLLRKAGGGGGGGARGPPPLRLVALMKESLELLHATQPAVAYQRYGVPAEQQNTAQWLAAVRHLPVLQVRTNPKNRLSEVIVRDSCLRAWYIGSSGE
jgi:hypothetical protein